MSFNEIIEYNAPIEYIEVGYGREIRKDVFIKHISSLELVLKIISTDSTIDNNEKSNLNSIINSMKKSLKLSEL